jgi:hypothetical protein
MELNNGKYSSLVGLGFLSEIKGEIQSLTPYIKLMIRMKSDKGEWIYLGSKDVNFPTTLEELSIEFESLIRRIDNPDYDDEIAY